MAKSSRPSPLKSAVTIVPGWFTITGDVVAENVPSPFPNRIVTVLSLRFTTARSSSPSLLKSPRTSVKGPCPTGTGEPEAALNVPSPLPSKMLTMFPIPSLTAKSALPSLLKSAATMPVAKKPTGIGRSEEHTSELQSQFHLVCRLLLEKKKKKHIENEIHITD